MDLEPLRYARHDSPVGPVWLAATSKGLAAAEIGVSEEQAMATWRRRTDHPLVRDDAALRPYAHQLDQYFAGALTRFHLPLDVQEGTPFQRQVWAALATIPYGETRSYKWLAEQVGQQKGFRAVGRANGCNPLPIIVPCHRVVNVDGRLGGYSSGLQVKRALLRLEGALPA